MTVYRISTNWRLLHTGDDLLGPSYKMRTFAIDGQPDEVQTTLVHHTDNPTKKQAVLYLHGYTDYFFQTGLAEHFIQLGYRFYAIDLQGYGRSIRPHHRPNWCDSLSQYHQDMDIALATMKEDGIEQVVILGHSTGGLIVSTYLAKTDCFKGQLSNESPVPKINGLILNSPFLALPFSPKQLNYLSTPIMGIVNTLPFISIPPRAPTVYAKTLHKRFSGEWNYRLDWKPAEGFPLSFYWLKQIILAQRQLTQQHLDLPTLMCCSNISTIGKKTVEETIQGDGVLNVDSMIIAAKKVFTNLTLVRIDKGFHDLYLSRPPAREAYIASIDNWLQDIKAC